MNLLYFVACFLGVASLGLITVAWLFRRISSIAVEHEKARSIADAIQEGAMTFLKEEYRIIAVVVIAVAGVLSFFLSPLSATVRQLRDRGLILPSISML